MQSDRPNAACCRPAGSRAIGEVSNKRTAVELSARLTNDSRPPFFVQNQCSAAVPMVQSVTMLNNHSTILILAWLAMTTVAANAIASPRRYHVTELPVLGARDINNHGQITGAYNPDPDSPLFRAYIYEQGVVTELNTPSGHLSVGNGINNLGHVVGSTFVGTTFVPFIFKNGTATNLDTLEDSSGASPESINDSGQIVGRSRQPSRAVRWDDGQISNMGNLLKGNFLSYTAGAFDINNHGQVVGKALTAGFADHAFLKTNGTTTDLGTLPSHPIESVAAALNDAGDVVGASYADFNAGSSHAFLYSNGEMHDLGAMDSTNSYATDINNLQEIVGFVDKTTT